MTGKVATCFWFDDQALDAAEFYVSLLPGSRLAEVSHYLDQQDKAAVGRVLAVEFILAGTPYMALNGGPHFSLSEAASIRVMTEDQDETDRLWSDLTRDGGAESQCGWLKDRFGLCWQIVPRRAMTLLGGPQARKVWASLMTMRKIHISTLETAAA